MSLYEYIYERRWIRKYSWIQISDGLQAGVSEGTMQKRYRRLCNKVKQPYKPKPIERVIHEPTIHIKDEHIDDEVDILDLVSIARTRYGEIDPTNYISDLSHDDWNDKYVDYVMRDRINNRKIFRRDGEEYVQWQIKWRLPYITELGDTVWNERVVLVLLPRTYGKTERMIVLFCRWILEIQDSLYIVVPSSTHGKKLMRKIIRILKNPRIRRDYGDVGTKPIYDNDMFYMEYNEKIEWIDMDFPLSIVTWGSAKEGPHPTWIHFEDVHQKEFKNIDSNDDIEWTYDNTFDKMGAMKVTATGTRYALSDYYTMLRDKYTFKLVHYKALPGDGTWLECPNYTKEKLEEMRDRDDASFSTKMNNMPVSPSGVYFSKDDWKEINMPIKKFNKYVFVDPAFGFTGSKTAILVVGIYMGELLIVDSYIGHADFDAKEEIIVRFAERYNTLQEWVEDNFRQMSRSFSRNSRLTNLRGLHLMQSTNDKAQRIAALKWPYASLEIKIVKGCAFLHDIKMEYLGFNLRQSPAIIRKKYNALDALSMAYIKLKRFMGRESSTRNQPKEQHRSFASNARKVYNQ